MAKKTKLSYNTKLFIIAAVILAIIILISGGSESAKFFAPCGASTVTLHAGQSTVFCFKLVGLVNVGDPNVILANGQPAGESIVISINGIDSTIRKADGVKTYQGLKISVISTVYDPVLANRKATIRLTQ